MKVRFVETMRGVLAAAGDSEWPVEFTISVEATSVRRFLGGERAPSRGVIRAAPWAGEAVCEGELSLSLVPSQIRYRLSFVADDGRTLTLAGHKSVSVRALQRSMTTLPVELSDAGGQVLATGTLWFDLRELGGFLRSFSPLADRQRQALDASRVALLRRSLDA